MDENNEMRPIAFYSHKFSPAKRNYDVFDKELLAILACLKHWRRYLEGTSLPVVIYSDHKNLVNFTTNKKRKQRHYRWEEELSRFHFIIKYIEGELNIVPDILSRRPDLMIDDEEYTLQNQKPILDITKLVNIVIPHDEIYAKVLQDMVDHEELHLWADRKNYSLNGQVLKYQEKLVVVVKERQKEIVQQFHNSLIGGHNGVRKNT